YFVKDILPLIYKERPDVEAVFVGRNAPPHIMSLNKVKGVKITGAVDDVRPYMEEGDVYIVPLRIGGGTRLKILDALAMRKAVVSTSIGAEGLDLQEGKHLLIADTPERFAAKVLKLLEDPGLVESLGEAGRKQVEEKYGWDQLAAKLEKFVSSLVEGK
ncbi:MAG: glycosyltransferase family 4 protein, partial [Candidatus Zixiibacteriota bacterium]